MRQIQLLAIATFLSILVGGGIYLLVEKGDIPITDSAYSPTFRTLDISTQGPVDVLVQRKNYIFREEDEYLAFWELLHGNDPGARRAPLVSFARESVIAVMGGVHISGGYDIIIENISETPDERLIEILMTSPSSECSVASVLTNPYHMIVLKKTDKALRAVDRTEVYSCEE